MLVRGGQITVPYPEAPQDLRLDDHQGGASEPGTQHQATHKNDDIDLPNHDYGCAIIPPATGTRFESRSHKKSAHL